MENNNKQKISTPTAIIVAGFIIMIAILITRGGSAGNTAVAKEKTLSEQVGVSKEALASCIKSTDSAALSKNISTSVENAMSNLPSNQKGTPYSVVIGKDGVKTEILGANTYENVKKIIDDATIGKVTKPYVGKIVESEPGDHTLGNPNAVVKIIEYSDYECPYCKAFHSTLDRIIKESNGSVSWTYRHWPIHQGSFAKLTAAECVAQIKGNDAFWEYSSLLFGLLKTQADPVTDQL